VSAALTSEVIKVTDDPMAVYELSLREKWGDGAPIIPPTDKLVERLLAATPLPADNIIGVLPPRYNEATVEYAAINATMAGCEPDAFPLVLAALQGIVQREFNAPALTTTTSSTFPYVIVNGPSRDRFEVNYRTGCLGGAGGRGSMTIGRAVSLCLRNIGGQRAGETSRSVFGQPGRFGVCFGEWEERSPWPSLAQRRGFGREREVVTVYSSNGNVALCDINNDDPRDLTYMLAKSLADPMANYFSEPNGDPGQVVLLVTPIWAERFSKAFPQVSSFQEYLWENAWQPIDLWRPANQAILRKKNRVDGKGRVFMTSRPEQIVPVVCGGLGGLHSMFLPSWCETEMQSFAVERA
jgi:hypothetical protein